jgi:hypothetical protein
MPHERHTNRELKTYLTFNSHSTKQVAVEVVEAKTLEVTLAHFWSSASGTEHTADIDLEVRARAFSNSWFVRSCRSSALGRYVDLAGSPGRSLLLMLIRRMFV